MRDHVRLTARRVRFLLPMCWQKGELARLLEAEPRTLDCDDVKNGRELALLGCLNDVLKALARPREVDPRNRVVTQGPTATVILALLSSLATRLRRTQDRGRARPSGSGRDLLPAGGGPVAK